MKRQPGTPMQSGVDRRTFLKGSVAAGAATLSGGVLAGAVKAAARRPADTPLKHIIVDCQENRSFDHYYGYAPQVRKAGFGPPAGYTQPDGPGGSVVPYRFTDLETPDIG